MDYSIIFCAKNPHNLRTAASYIVEKVDVEVTSGTKYILMGEEHNRSTHRLLQQAVMQLLLSGGSKIAYHVESDHSTLARPLKTRAAYNDKQIETICANDRYGALVIRAALSFESFGYTPKTFENIFGFCLAEKIKTHFIDAAKYVADAGDHKKYLNLRDTETKATATAYYGHELQSNSVVPVESAEGMSIRNKLMVQKSLAHAKHDGADVVVVHCGYQHLFGSVSSGFNYADSLAAQFRKCGIDPHIVIPSYKENISDIPAEAREAGHLVTVVEGLFDMSLPRMDEVENQIIDGVVSHSGGAVARHDVTDKISQWRRNFSADAKALLKRAPA